MPQVKLKYRHYRFYDQFEISFHAQTIEKKLKYLIDPFAVQFTNNKIADITLSQSLAEMPKSDHEHYQGKYKGIPWAIDISKEKREGSRGIVFYSGYSSDFLFPRMVLIPFLRKELADGGGFSAIGASFCHDNTRYVIVGRPGTGKTKLLLEAVHAGAIFVGDDEFMIDQKGNIAFLFDCIEIRYGTIKSTIFWERLSKTQQLRTVKNLIIQKLSGGKISFNIVVAPIQLGISSEKSKPYDRTVFVMMKRGAEPSKVSADEIISNNKQYEHDHMALFGDFLYGKADLERSHDSMRKYLSQCDLWQMPPDTAVDKIFEL